MFFIFLLLLLFFFFPVLFAPVLIFLIIGILFLLPYVLIFNSFYNVITIPWQIIKIAFNRCIRKNHSLEHATINVLEQRYNRDLKIGGLAYGNGFTLSGPDLPPPYEVLAAVREGHYRMSNGETKLAIHPRCGTSIAAANFLFSLAFILVLFCFKNLSFVNIILAFVLANILAKPFGRILQKYFTTHPDVSDLTIVDIYQKPTGFSFEFMMNPNRTYFIRTANRTSSRFFLN